VTPRRAASPRPQLPGSAPKQKQQSPRARPPAKPSEPPPPPPPPPQQQRKRKQPQPASQRPEPLLELGSPGAKKRMLRCPHPDCLELQSGPDAAGRTPHNRRVMADGTRKMVCPDHPEWRKQ
jgi:hypothetical protein